MFSPIIRSTWLYLQYLVVFTQVAAGWCLGWFETAASQLRCCIITGHGGHSMDTEATRHFRARGFFGDFYLRNLSALRQKLIHVSLKIIQRIDKKKSFDSTFPAGGLPLWVSTHPRHQPAATWWILPEAVNTVNCSWWWAKHRSKHVELTYLLHGAESFLRS